MSDYYGLLLEYWLEFSKFWVVVVGMAVPAMFVLSLAFAALRKIIRTGGYIA